MASKGKGPSCLLILKENRNSGGGKKTQGEASRMQRLPPAEEGLASGDLLSPWVLAMLTSPQGRSASTGAGAFSQGHRTGIS